MFTFFFKAGVYFVWRLIPESPRWLIAKDRLDEAHELLMKYAKRNRVTVESTQLKHAIQEFKKEEVRNRNENRRTYGILDMVRTPKLRKRTIICGFNWWVDVHAKTLESADKLRKNATSRIWGCDVTLAYSKAFSLPVNTNTLGLHFQMSPLWIARVFKCMRFRRKWCAFPIALAWAVSKKRVRKYAFLKKNALTWTGPDTSVICGTCNKTCYL